MGQLILRSTVNDQKTPGFRQFMVRGPNGGFQDLCDDVLRYLFGFKIVYGTSIAYGVYDGHGSLTVC